MFMNEEKEETVLIKIKTGERIVVPKRRLTADSSKFRELFDTLKFDEHEIDDFSPEAVEIFLALLDSKVLLDLEMRMFRELHKLAVIFEVGWLIDSCRRWLKQNMNITSTKEEKISLFEECWFIFDKLNDEEMMNEMVSVYAHENNSMLLTDYLSDISKLETGKIDALLRLGGVNTDIFLKSILQNLEGKNELNPNVKHLLNGMNLASCSERNQNLYLEVLDTISNLPDISKSDLRFVQKLMSDTAKLVTSRKERRKPRATVVFDKKKEDVLFNSCKTIKDVVNAVTENNVLSMFKVVELLLYVFVSDAYTCEELYSFVISLETLCAEKKLQKVSRGFIDTITSALKYSVREEAKQLICLLNEIKNNSQLTTCNEYVLIKNYSFLDNVQYFEHPLSLNCAETDSKFGFIMLRSMREDNWNYKVVLCTKKEHYDKMNMHTHDDISASDMYLFGTMSATCIVVTIVILATVVALVTMETLEAVFHYQWLGGAGWEEAGGRGGGTGVQTLLI